MNLLNFLKANKDSRKIFGKRELKIIEKQLQGMNLTQSEKNRLSRDIRKKLEFIEEAARYSDEFELKKSKYVKEIIEDAKYAILKSSYSKKIKKIILYGSFVENLIHLGSDVDIAVEFDSINKKEASKFRLGVLGEVNEKIDLQVYNVLPEKLKKEIDKKGGTIYERKD